MKPFTPGPTSILTVSVYRPMKQNPIVKESTFTQSQLLIVIMFDVYVVVVRINVNAMKQVLSAMCPFVIMMMDERMIIWKLKPTTKTSIIWAPFMLSFLIGCVRAL